MGEVTQASASAFRRRAANCKPSHCSQLFLAFHLNAVRRTMLGMWNSKSRWPCCSKSCFHPRPLFWVLSLVVGVLALTTPSSAKTKDRSDQNLQIFFIDVQGG